MSVVYQYNQPQQPLSGMGGVSRKKLLVLAALAVVGVVLLIVSTATSKSSVAPAPGAQTSSVANTFVNYISSGKIEDANNLMFSGQKSKQDLAGFKQNVYEPITLAVEAKSCKNTGTTDKIVGSKGGFYQTTYSCSTKNAINADDRTTLVLTDSGEKVFYYEILEADASPRSITDILADYNISLPTSENGASQ